MCKHFQQFGIENLIWHEDFKRDLFTLENDIALIRVNRPIQFESKMQPICLPFVNNNHIPEPRVRNLLTYAGWSLNEKTNTLAKFDAIFMLFHKDWCEKPVDETKLCVAAAGQANCYGDSGGPLMKRFDKRMVLEGIVSYGHWDCEEHNTIYTRIRSYGHWLDNKMQM